MALQIGFGDPAILISFVHPRLLVGIELTQTRPRNMTSYKTNFPFSAVLAFTVTLLLTIAVQTGCAGLPRDPQTLRPAKANQPVQNAFGFDFHDPFTHWPAEPFTYWRVWDAGVDWARIETAPGVFDFNLLDQYVALAAQHNIKMVYVAGNTPQWASTAPNHVGTQGLPGATAPPTDFSIWRNFVQTLATRYKGRIFAYEIWNEADLPGYWTGDLSEMLQICQIAYQTIKRVDPGATVLAPSLVAGNGLDYLKNFLSMGGAQFTDAIAYHLYNTNRSPEVVVTFDQQALNIAQMWGKPIWDTEFGWGPWGSWSDPEAASFLARSLILQSSQGISPIIWYAWDDRGPWVHLFLVQSDFQTPTLAATAYAQVTSWLIGSTITCSSETDGSWQCQLSGSAGTRYVVWNPDNDESFPIPASWNVKKSTDLQGNVQSIGGQVEITSSPLLLEP